MSDPEVVVGAEPMAGVTPALTQSLLGHVKDLREQGMTVIFVEHDMDVVRDISDWVVVMADRKSTRLNSSHANISYAVFCLKKKKKKEENVYDHSVEQEHV